jgi:hypothetical protein
VQVGVLNDIGTTVVSTTSLRLRAVRLRFRTACEQTTPWLHKALTRVPSSFLEIEGQALLETNRRPWHDARNARLRRSST